MDITEFDGNTVLCRVCGDKASGFHYGVHACEGCKGFFRRSIQQKIQYRPCLKNQMCNIMRVNRNRCQYCRLRKCIAVGMSRDAVRFGRVPKREKAKILEQMQKVNSQLQCNLLNDVLDTPGEVIQRVISAHIQTCEFTRAKFEKLFEKAWQCPQFVDCPAHMACPLNPSPDESESIQKLQKWDEFSSCFTPAIRSVVNFAKSIPGFTVFSQEDQVTLLKAGTFEVLLVHLACLFDSRTNTMMFSSGKLYRKMSNQGTNAGFLLDSMFDFADRLNQLHLTDEELALFSAMVIVAHDRPGLRYPDQVQRVHSILSQGLQTLMQTSHRADPTAHSKLLMKIPDLRTLNTLHSEKLLGLTVPQTECSSISPSDPTPTDTMVSDRKPVLPAGGPPPNHTTTLPQVEPITARDSPSDSSNHCHVITVPGPYPSSFSSPMIRCPMSDTPPGGRPTHHDAHTPGQPIIPHQVAIDNQEKQLILQTPLGSFHRHIPPYAHLSPGLSAMIKMEAEMQAKTIRPCDSAQMKDVNHIARQQAVDSNRSLKGHPIDCSNTPLSATSSSKASPSIHASHCSPDDFIDADIPKSTNHKFDPKLIPHMPKADMRRVMTDPMVPEIFRKRLLEMFENESDPKVARLWDYDMRSSRSNSLSSSSSQESVDSAYRTISNPATPRSVYELTRSPYASPEVSVRSGPIHPASTPLMSSSMLMEDRFETRMNGHKQMCDPLQSCDQPQSCDPADSYLPTLRNMLINGRMDVGAMPPGCPINKRQHWTLSEDKTTEVNFINDGNKHIDPNRSEFNARSDVMRPDMKDQDGCIRDLKRRAESPTNDDEHYWIHKKLKLKQSLFDRTSPDVGSMLPPVRERAASFSTVSRIRQRMAPPTMKPTSLEAPPRLGTKPSEIPTTATFGAIVSKVMEAALLSENRSEPEKAPQSPQSSSSRMTPSSKPNVMISTDPEMVLLSESSKYQSNDGSVVVSLPKPAACTDVSGRVSMASSFSSLSSMSKSSSSNPSQRHPELLSRLNSRPGMSHTSLNSEKPLTVRERSRTPPPRLYPIWEQSHKDLPNKHSPPLLLPINKVSQQDRVTTCSSPVLSTSHLSTISSLKDKILKRIDSQENLARMSPGQSIWRDSPVLHDADTENRKQRCPDDRPSPQPASTAPNTLKMSQRQTAPPPLPMAGGSLTLGLPPTSVSYPPPPAPLGASMHQALLYNAAVQQYQNLQFQVQASQLQHHMQRVSSDAQMRSTNPSVTCPPIARTTQLPRDGSEGAGRHGDASHFSQDAEPINLTKSLARSPPLAVKSEPV